MYTTIHTDTNIHTTRGRRNRFSRVAFGRRWRLVVVIAMVLGGLGVGGEVRAVPAECRYPLATVRGVAHSTVTLPRSAGVRGEACIYQADGLPGSSERPVKLSLVLVDSDARDRWCVKAQVFTYAQPTARGYTSIFVPGKHQSSISCGGGVVRVDLPVPTSYRSSAGEWRGNGRFASMALRVCLQDKDWNGTCSSWNTWWIAGDGVQPVVPTTPGARGGLNIGTR